jgi:hypothetical protein
MTETLGVLAYFFFPAFTGFIGAYCGLIKKRTSKISFPEALVIFLITWPVTALAVFILSTIESPRDSWRLIGLSQAATVVA